MDTVPSGKVAMPFAHRRQLTLVAGPLLAAVLGWMLVSMGYAPELAWTAAITMVCAVWWVGEAIPLSATALLPLAMMPLVGVTDSTTVASAYSHPLVLLLMGGFILSRAVERSGAHETLALHVIRAVGTNSPRRLLLGFMVASAVMSMWISNVATTLALMPVALATLSLLGSHALEAPLLLGLAYAANVGGIGTPVGTPPNLIFFGAYDSLLSANPTLQATPWTFLSWMRIGVPMVLVLVPLLWWNLGRRLPDGQSVQLQEPQPFDTTQRHVLLVFGITVLLWIFRRTPMGGWSSLIGAGSVGNASVAALAVVALFLIPNGRGGRLMDWETAETIPWGLLLLFGGGIALSKAFVTSGLSDLIVEMLGGLAAVPTLLMIFTVTVLVVFLTELTSNTATTALMMPILGSVALAAKIDPSLLMVPACCSASCAFMLPVATGTNGAVYGTGKVSAARMAAEGLRLNLMVIPVITVLCWLLLR